jgi:hypothetical protein
MPLDKVRAVKRKEESGEWRVESGTWKMVKKHG